MQEHLHSGALVALLEQHRPPNTAVWGLHPPQRNLSPKVRQLVDFLRQRLGELAEYRRAC
ncbi:LysR substrate binding domain protein [compost metagenome]